MKTGKPNVSTTYHASRVRVESSRIAHDKKVDRIKHDAAQNIVLTIIVLCMLMVILAVLATMFFKPERSVSKKIEELAANYYENNLYKTIADSKPDSYTDVIKKYEESGFSSVSLRQVLLFNNEVKTSTEKTITKYCDENKTEVKFYPVSPYGVKDYRAEYKLSCTF